MFESAFALVVRYFVVLIVLRVNEDVLYVSHLDLDELFTLRR